MSAPDLYGDRARTAKAQWAAAAFIASCEAAGTALERWVALAQQVTPEAWERLADRPMSAETIARAVRMIEISAEARMDPSDPFEGLL